MTVCDALATGAAQFGAAPVLVSAQPSWRNIRLFPEVMMMRNALLSLSLTMFAVAAQADVVVKESWARATTPAQKASGAFMELTSSDDATLVSVASPIAGVAELHTMSMDNGVMKMRAIPRLELPAGKSVKLAPGGNHVMLMDLKQQLKKGDAVPLTLRVEGKDKKIQFVEIKVEVRDLAAPAAMDHSHKH